MNFETFCKFKDAETKRVNFEMTYVDMTNDLISGLLLSQIVYWFSPSKNGKSKTRVTYKGRKAIAKGRSDWFDEIRISPKQYDKAIKKLKDLGIVDVVNSLFNGMRTPFIMINEDVFIEKFVSTVENPTVFTKGEYRSLPKGNTGIDEKGIPLTEINTKINTKNKDIHSFAENMQKRPCYESVLEAEEHICGYTDNMEIVELYTLFIELFYRHKNVWHSELIEEQIEKVVEVLQDSIDEYLISSDDDLETYMDYYLTEKRKYYSAQEFFQLKNIKIWSARYHGTGNVD